MAKIEVKNVHNNHYPLGVVVLVDEENVELLEKDGFYRLNKQEEKPSEKWTEKQIKDWLLKNYPHLKYNIQLEKKKDKLEELRKLSLI